LNILTRGLHRKTALNFSGLYKNILHLGINLNLHKIEYHFDQSFNETDQNSESPVYNIDFENGLSSFGQGVSVQIGAIVRLKNLRLGLTYDSPQFFEILDQTKQKVSSFYIDQGSVVKETIDPNIINSYEAYLINLPSKTTLSAAYVFGGKGLLSLDYGIQNPANTVLSRNSGSGYLDNLTSSLPNTFVSIQTIKVGGEYRFNDISLRAGILNQNNAHKSVSTSDHAFTFGLGLDFGSNTLNLSFVQLNNTKKFNMFSEGLTDPYTLSNNISQVSLSYNIKL
jgi:predicted porin